jgi:Domain of unknown function (DUF4158)
MPRPELLSPAQREALMVPPSDLNECIRYYTLSANDLHLISQHRGIHNQLGFAVQLLDQGITVYATEADALQAAHELLDTSGAPPPVSTRGAATAQRVVSMRSTGSWAKPVEQLSIAEMPAVALSLNVQGRRLFGPLQGFGQMWQKTYRIVLRNRELTPQQVIAAWKENVPRLKPPQKRFYPELPRHRAQRAGAD